MTSLLMCCNVKLIWAKLYCMLAKIIKFVGLFLVGFKMLPLFIVKYIFLACSEKNKFKFFLGSKSN